MGSGKIVTGMVDSLKLKILQMELKFRCWDEANKRFHYWGYDVFSDLPKGIFTGPINPSFPSTQYTCHKVNGQDLYVGDILRNTKFSETEDENEYLVCCYIKEWSMFGLLMVDEYHKYLEDGAEGLDETDFWTFPIEDKENEQRRICGNIYDNKNLLQTT